MAGNIRKYMLAASLIVGVLAAVSTYIACSFGRCPADKLHLAILLFFVGAAISYVIKYAAIFRSGLKKQG